MTQVRRKAQIKRALILDAAVRVFAQKGYHKTRISDIAKEAGIAYGLVYHYFPSKESMFQVIFQEKWAVFVQVVKSVSEDQSSNLQAKLRALVGFIFESYRQNPELNEVILLEMIHSPQFRQDEMREQLQWAYGLAQNVFVDAQNSGELPATVNTIARPLLFMGSLETILTGLAFRYIPDSESAQRAVTDDIVKVYSAP